MNLSLFPCALLAAVLVLANQPALAARITWTAHDISAGDGAADVLTEGVLVEARNGALTDITVNGVTFRSTANSGNLFDSLFAYDNIKGREGAIVTGNYRAFLQFGQRSGRPGFGPETKPDRILPTKDWAAVHFTGLTIGHTYQIQLWTSNVDNVSSNARNIGLLLGNGSAEAPVLGIDTMLFNEVQDGPGASGYGMAGQYGIGTFVADATTQSFHVQTYLDLLTSPKLFNCCHFSNGWQLRDLGKGGKGGTHATRPAPPVTTLPSALVRLHSTDSTMTLEFNQPLNKASATNPDNYTISLKGGGAGSFSKAALSGDGRTVTLTYGIPLMIDGSTYIIGFGNLTSADGTPIPGKKAIEFRP